MAHFRQQRFAEALETCKLTTEIHPEIWSTWYNLGNTQRAVGQRQEALLSYRRVLEIDPSNFNGPQLRALFAMAAASFIPADIRYGATLAETQAALAGSCRSLTACRIDPPFQVLHDIKGNSTNPKCCLIRRSSRRASCRGLGQIRPSGKGKNRSSTKESCRQGYCH